MRLGIDWRTTLQECGEVKKIITYLSFIHPWPQLLKQQHDQLSFFICYIMIGLLKESGQQQ